MLASQRNLDRVLDEVVKAMVASGILLGAVVYYLR